MRRCGRLVYYYVRLISSQVFSQRGGVPMRSLWRRRAEPALYIALLDVSYIFKNHPRFQTDDGRD